MRPEQKKTVLVVDDEESLRKLNRLILERAGYRVLVAGSAQDALVISRGCPEQIDLLLSDVEMPGINGIALGDQIAAERPGIAVLLNSANPTYMLDTQFAFLSKPFSPKALQMAIAQTLECRTQTAARVEPEAIPSLMAEESCFRPEINLPETQRVEAFPFVINEDQAGRDSRQVLAEPARRLPETVLPARSDLSTLKTAARNLAIVVRRRTSGRRLPHAIPAWVPAAAALILAIVPFSLHQSNEGLSASPYSVSLQAVRGLAGEAAAPTGKPLLLNLDVTSLPQADSYEIEIVNGDGQSLWQRVVPAQGPEVSTQAAALRSGTYFVRVYGPARELLKEYKLAVTEMH